MLRPGSGYRLAQRMSSDTPLVLVSNRGPVTFQAGGEIKRGTGGLVTALIGLASHRPVTWVASAMTDEDVAAAERTAGGRSRSRTPDGDEYRVKLVASDPEAYDGFYNIIANPMLWFIQHYLWDLSNAPDIRRNETEAFEFGYNAVNEDLARRGARGDRGRREAGGDGPRLPPLHAARPDPPRAPRRVPAPLRPHPVEPVGLLARAALDDPPRDLRRDPLQRHRRLPHPLLPAQLPAVLRGPDRARGRPRRRASCSVERPRGVGPRLPAADRRRAPSRRSPAARGCASSRAELLRRRRDHLILRVDRADLSKNVLRGFSAFDTFLEQHPEFRERVTFIAQLMPSRTDVAEYAEYLERIEAVVAVVNHRHGSPDWMPIQLKLRDDLEEAVAAYKHYDVLMVNAMFDGMNLVAKEGPMVNERAGVSVLSENTGAHEELGEYALSVNPFDIQELADSIHAALTMPIEERRRRHEGLNSIVTARNPGDWIDEQLADIRAKGARWSRPQLSRRPRGASSSGRPSRRRSM